MPRKSLVSARMSAAQLSALAPTGEQFDVVDPAVTGLILRGYEALALSFSMARGASPHRARRFPRDRYRRGARARPRPPTRDQARYRPEDE